VVKHLLLLGSFLQREASRLLEAHGLNQQQFVVLKEIDERGPLHQKELCSALLFEKSNVSKIVAKLVHLRLLDVGAPPDDARKTVLSATPRGRAVVGVAMRALDRWNAAWLAALEDREVASVLAALEKLKQGAG
jgi:DNA-binding MarR family transcriptional regulator